MRVAMPMVPSDAHEAAAEVVARLVGFEAAEVGDRTVGQHDVDREHVGGGDARRQAVRATGVGGDVAADRARLLRRRVRRVVQTEVRDLATQVEVEHAGLHPGHALVGVDLEHAVELRGHDDDGIVDRGRAAGEPGATPPGHERPVVLRRDPHRARDLVARSREAHRPRRCPRATPASRE